VNQLVRVLTAVDFSEPGSAAFNRALALSRKHDAELTVVHAVPKEHRFQWGARERIDMIASQRARRRTLQAFATR
jgi:nucleotide-binding universal stress UspA family protein